MPRPTIAIVGASADRRKFGNKAVRAYAAQGYEVFPVHPTAARVEGLAAYPSVRDIPRARLDRVSLYVPPAIGLGVLDELRDKEIGELWVNPGAESAELLEKARGLGIPTIFACSILAVGVSPSELA